MQRHALPAVQGEQFQAVRPPLPCTDAPALHYTALLCTVAHRHTADLLLSGQLGHVAGELHPAGPPPENRICVKNKSYLYLLFLHLALV